MGTIPLPHPTSDELVVTNLIVCNDVEASAVFYSEVLGGTLVRSGGPGPTVVKLANAWITLVQGGGPTPDKPTVTLTAPNDVDDVNSFLNLRVVDINAIYADWTARGARFLTVTRLIESAQC